MRFRRWTALLAVVSIALAGCSSVKEELKPVALQPIETKLSFSKKWRKNTGAGQDARYTRLQPAAHEGVIYTVDVEGTLGAYRIDDGSRLWQNKLDQPIGGGVGVFGESGFVGTLDGQVIAFSLSDGTVRWRAQASSEILSAPQANQDVVVAAAIDGRVFAFDVETGERRWNYDHPTPILTLRSNAAPLVLENRVHVAFDNGQLLSFDADDGQLNWATRIGQPTGKTELERLIDADTSPIEYGPYIYGAAYNARLVAINRGTGRIEWASDVSTAHNITASDNTIVVTEANSHVKAFDAETGSLLWENDKLHRRDVGPPGIYGSVVLVVDMDGYLHGLALADGSLVARSKISDHALAQPIVVDETVFLYDLKGNLTAMTANTHKQKSTSVWDLPTGRESGAVATKFTGASRTQ